jgi:hypothetical protein
MSRESIAKDMKSAGFPVIESLSNCVYRVGEIPFSPDWIPKGEYNGIIKELKSVMDGYSIQLVYLPSVNNDALAYLPPILLPSGFDVTPFPKNIRYSEDDGFNLNCGFEKEYIDNRSSLFAFDGGGDYQGLWEPEKEKWIGYMNELKGLFESGSGDWERINVIDAIRLRKKTGDFSHARLEDSRRFFRKHGFKSAVFETRSLIGEHNNYREHISQLDITNAHKEPDQESNVRGIRMAVSYRDNDDRYVGSPSMLSVLVCSGRDSFLDGGDLRIMEDFAGMF